MTDWRGRALINDKESAGEMSIFRWLVIARSTCVCLSYYCRSFYVVASRVVATTLYSCAQCIPQSLSTCNQS